MLLKTIDYLCRESFTVEDEEAFFKYINEFSAATRNYAKRQLHWYRKDEVLDIMNKFAIEDA